MSVKLGASVPNGSIVLAVRTIGAFFLFESRPGCSINKRDWLPACQAENAQLEAYPITEVKRLLNELW